MLGAFLCAVWWVGKHKIDSVLISFVFGSERVYTKPIAKGNGFCIIERTTKTREIKTSVQEKPTAKL